MRAKKCPALRWVVEDRIYGGEARIRAFDRDGAVVGVIRGNWADRPTEVWVSSINVLSQLRRCGIGTQLWTKLAQWTCTQKKSLISDRLRSAGAEMFWRKQVRKKRAVCVKGKGGSRFFPFPEESWNKPQTWPCEYFKLNCPVTSLAGGRRR